MVDSKDGSFDNVINLHSRLDRPLPRAAFPQSSLPLDTFLAQARKLDPASFDFRLPSMDGENRRNVQIIGFSFVMALALTGTAVALVSIFTTLRSVFA